MPAQADITKVQIVWVKIYTSAFFYKKKTGI